MCLYPLMLDNETLDNIVHYCTTLRHMVQYCRIVQEIVQFWHDLYIRIKLPNLLNKKQVFTFG